MDFSLPCCASQHQSGNNSHEKKAENLDEYVTGRVNAWETIPVPVRNVGCYPSQYSCHKYKTKAAAKRGDSRLRQQPNHQNCFQKFRAEFDCKRFTKRELTPGRMIHENTGRVRR